MSVNFTQSEGVRAERLRYCATTGRESCCVGPTGPAGSFSYTATQDIDMSCNRMLDVSNLTFCDGTYMGPGVGFDISTNQPLVIRSTDFSGISMTGNQIVSIVPNNTRFEVVTGGNVAINQIGLPYNPLLSLLNTDGDEAQIYKKSTLIDGGNLVIDNGAYPINITGSTINETATGAITLTSTTDIIELDSQYVIANAAVGIIAEASGNILVKSDSGSVTLSAPNTVGLVVDNTGVTVQAETAPPTLMFKEIISGNVASIQYDGSNLSVSGDINKLFVNAGAAMTLTTSGNLTISAGTTVDVVSGITKFTQTPECANVPITANQLVNKLYVDTPSVEDVSGTTDLDPTKSVSYVSGPSHKLTPGTVLGFQKTIINNGFSVFSTTGNGVDGGASGAIYKMVQATTGLGAGLIFACGDVTLFQSIGTASNVNGIAAYNPTGSTIAGIPAYTWRGLGTGLQPLTVSSGGIAYAMTFDLSGDLYVGGTFNTAGGVPNTKYIAKWTVGTTGAPATWEKLTSSSIPDISGTQVRALTTDPSGNIYVGGTFTTVNGILVNNVCRYVPSTGVFSALGVTGVTGSPVTGLYFDASSGFLYVGGLFTTAGATPALNVAYWDTSGSTWNAMGPGVVGQVNGFYRYSPTALYAYGAITNIGPSTTAGAAAGRFAVWNGSSWLVQGLGATAASITDAFADGSGMYFMVAAVGIQYLDLTNYGLGNYGSIPLVGSGNTALKIPGTRTYYVAGSFTALGPRDRYVNNICTINLDNEVLLTNFYNFQPSKCISTLYGDNTTFRWNGSFWMREQSSGSYVFLRA